ncbi:hypothetical protein [Haloarcula litorea]|uniref:hypothetical protein n=1 Tax=Haloarcula litorea TaxID=3032579 RepID=UPI0023E78F56|nr:hypothetical protein [Halomicroarcula sp. GDY20]
MNVDWQSQIEGVRAVLIVFLGLNIAWTETSVNAITMSGSHEMLGWPPFNLYMPAIDWFWTHLVLTILTVVVLIYSYHTIPPRRGEPA